MDAMTAAWGTEISAQRNGKQEIHIEDLQTSTFQDQGIPVLFRHLKSVNWEQDSIASQRLRLRSVTVSPIQAGSEPARAARTQLAPEMVWLAEHAAEIESGYRGQWLLLNGAELLSHSADFAEIRREIEELGLRSPFLYFVPNEQDLEFIA